MAQEVTHKFNAQTGTIDPIGGVGNMTPQEHAAKTELLSRLEQLAAISQIQPAAAPQSDPRAAQLQQMRAPEPDTPMPSAQLQPEGQEMDRLQRLIAARSQPQKPQGALSTILEGALQGLAYGAKAPEVMRQKEQDARSLDEQRMGRVTQLQQIARQRQGDAMQTAEADRQAQAFPLEQEQRRAGIDATRNQMQLANAPKPFETSPGTEYGVTDPKTGQRTVQGKTEAKPANAGPLHLESVAFKKDSPFYTGKPQDVLFQLDPDSGQVGKVFLPTASGLQDVTGQTEHYDKPSTIAPLNVNGLADAIMAQPKLLDRLGAADIAKVAPELSKRGMTDFTKAATPEEKKVLSFFKRATGAIENVAPIENEVAKLSLPGQVRLREAPNFAQTAMGKKYNQAVEDFVNVTLRRESGAAISNEEYDRFARIYFAMPGDDASTLAQKKKARETLLGTLKSEAGKAYVDEYEKPNASPAADGIKRTRIKL